MTFFAPEHTRELVPITPIVSNIARESLKEKQTLQKQLST